MNIQKELVFDIGTRSIPGELHRYEAFAPDLPGFRIEADDDFDALQQAKQGLLDHLSSILAAGKPIPEPQPEGYYLNDERYSNVLWHFVKVTLGPRLVDEPAVESVLPECLENGLFEPD